MTRTHASVTPIDPIDPCRQAHSSVSGVLAMLVTVAVYAFLLFCGNAIWKSRELPRVKSSSPVFGLLMHAGAAVAVTFAWCVLGAPSHFTCNARWWLLGLGFSIFFGCFVVKTYRIHRIFDTRVLVVAKLPDHKLFKYLAVRHSNNRPPTPPPPPRVTRHPVSCVDPRNSPMYCRR